MVVLLLSLISLRQIKKLIKKVAYIERSAACLRIFKNRKNKTSKAK